MILVLVSPRQRGIDLAAALPDRLEKCVVLTGGPVPAGAEQAAETVTVTPYRTEDIVEAGLRLAQRHPISRVVSFAEADVLAAATLREQLQLPGQHPASAQAYRDKGLMRRYTADAGLPAPRWWLVERASQVRAFAGRHGWPVVVKPRSSSGSVGVHVLHSEADLARLPAELPGHLVEQLVEGEAVHVDGLIVEGRPVFALPAAYTELGCLAHWADRGSGSYLLGRDHPWYRPLVEELWRVVAALPGDGTLLLHAEFFVAEGRRPVLCEIASRLPGHPIPPMINRALGVDLRHTWLRIAAGLPVDLDRLTEAAANPVPVANYGLPPRLGRLAALPGEPPAECAGWVHDLMPLAQPGEVWDEARYAERKSGDFVLTWTVTAPNHAVLDQRLRRAAELFEEQVRWERPDDHDHAERTTAGTGSLAAVTGGGR